jgi:metal-responsive CopG/Arc/MetJ family transcriptional regulator
VRVNITLPEDVLEEIDRYAVSHGHNRSDVLAGAAKQVMQMESVAGKEEGEAA